MINPDQRYIEFRANEGSQFYISKKVLCDHCGRSGACNMEGSSRGMWKSYVTKKCHEFMPVIAFKPPLIGFEGVFNTFRMGGAWVKRVAPGSQIGLLDTSTQSVFATATITDVISGDKNEMAYLHGCRNHLFKSQQLSDEVAAREIKKALRTLSGNLIYNNNTIATVIYMRRNDDKNHQKE